MGSGLKLKSENMQLPYTKFLQESKIKMSDFVALPSKYSNIFKKYLL